MNLTNLYLQTFIPQIPRILNTNFQSVQRYLDIFYDGSLGVIVVPVETGGKIKGSRGEFVTAIVDNLIVRNQFTNLYENSTTADLDYYNTYIGDGVTVRDASTFENSRFKYIDVNKPYYKINNDSSIAFLSNNLGQQIQLLFDVSTAGRAFNILLDPSINGTFSTLKVTASDSSTAWFALIAVEYDASWGTTWAIKQGSNNYTII
jgi:hypothetical protein